MQQWHFAIDRKQHGPVPEQEIRRLIALRVIVPTTLVWRDGLPQWVPAGTVAGFFAPGAAVRPVQQPAPVSTAAVPAPTQTVPANTQSAPAATSSAPLSTSSANRPAAAAPMAAASSKLVGPAPAALTAGGAFEVAVTSTSEELGGGEFVCNVTANGLTLNQGGRILAVPLGTAVDYEGGKTFTARLGIGAAAITVRGLGQYGRELAADIVAFVRKQRPMPVVATYNIQWYVHGLMLLPLGAVLVSGFGCFASIMAAAAVVACGVVYYFEAMPRKLRVLVPIAANALVYLIAVVSLVVTLAHRAATPREESGGSGGVVVGPATWPAPPRVVATRVRVVPPVPTAPVVIPAAGPVDAAAKLRRIESSWQVTGNSTDLMPTMSGRTARDAEGNYVLTNMERIMTDRAFATPVTFHIVAQTTSTNIRLSYAANQIIFNWEMNPDELRIDGGPANGQHKKGGGRVPVNEWVGMELVVRADEMVIYVDGQERQRVRADFSKVKEPLTLWTMGGSTMKVRAVGVVE